MLFAYLASYQLHDALIIRNSSGVPPSFGHAGLLSSHGRQGQHPHLHSDLEPVVSFSPALKLQRLH